MVKKTKKFLALALCASMVMGQSVVALAATTTGGTVDTESPIYSFNVVDILVPTTMDVAFNPGGNTITTGTDTTSTDQVVSRNFAVINKSTKDKVITAKITVTDLNDGENANKIKFVASEDEVTSAKADEYAIYLAAVPADKSAAPQAGGAAIDKTTTAAALADVTMTAVDAAAVPLAAGENTIEFKLAKATFAAKADSDVELGTSTGNDISASYELSAVGGVTAFAFTGSMKDSAAWEKLTKGIKISTVYSVRDVAETEAECVEDTNMLPAVPAGPQATVEFSSAAKVAASEDLGTADYTVKTVMLIKYTSAGKETAYNKVAAAAQYSLSNGTFTVPAAVTGAWTAAEYKITYQDAEGEEFVQTVKWTVETAEP